MATAPLTSDLLSQNAKEAAQGGPVFIADRGRTSYVLLTIENYLQITTKSASQFHESLADALSNAEAAEIDFDPPRLTGRFTRDIDLS